jgi:hypothetical protein
VCQHFSLQDSAAFFHGLQNGKKMMLTSFADAFEHQTQVLDFSYFPQAHQLH